MSLNHRLIMIAAILVGTIITRFLAFVVFPAGRETPQFVQYLGRVLPPAVFGMLVIYCYKSIDFTTGSRGLPELIAGAVVVLLHIWKRNLFLSILSGVAIYMILLRLPLL